MLPARNSLLMLGFIFSIFPPIIFDAVNKAPNPTSLAFQQQPQSHDWFPHTQIPLPDLSTAHRLTVRLCFPASFLFESG